MRSFWAGFLWTAVLWIIYLIHVGDAALISVGIWGCGIFYACFFLSDMFRSQPFIYTALTGGSLLSALTASYLTSHVANHDAEVWFALLIISFQTWRSAERLTGAWAVAFCVISIGSLIPLVILVDRWVLLPFIIIYGAAFVSASVGYGQAHQAGTESSKRYEALLDEYRKLKRNAKNNEDSARIEERTYIARKIHDSVGHKLTSLLMQLEMFRMQADGDARTHAEQMKRLAQDSLQETRSAVKALKEEEPGGIQALMRLIRNLEAESYMQIDFVVRHGALTVSLDNEQSIAVYRSIQEALTNAMRHGSSRNVSILLESPGGSVFRFEVSNETTDHENKLVHEGFGLNAMRDRMEKAGGTLEISRIRNKFIVRGTFVLRPEPV